MTYFFQIHTHNDFEGLRRCLQTVRQHMPNVFIQVISDGNYMDESMLAFVREMSDQLVIGEELMPWKKGGTGWIERRFRLALETGKDVCLKIDTDTRVWRKFNYIPAADYFGTVRKIDAPTAETYVQGGCMGTSKRFMQAIIDGKFFGGPEWLKDMPVWATQDIANPHLISGDRAVAEIAARELYVIPFEWDEINSMYSASRNPPSDLRNPLINGIPRYAVTHPHKDIKPTVIVGNPNTGILVEDALDAQWRFNV